MVLCPSLTLPQTLGVSNTFGEKYGVILRWGVSGTCLLAQKHAQGSIVSQKPGRDTKRCKREKLGQGVCVEEAPEQGVMCEQRAVYAEEPGRCHAVLEGESTWRLLEQVGRR